MMDRVKTLAALSFAVLLAACASSDAHPPVLPDCTPPACGSTPTDAGAKSDSGGSDGGAVTDAGAQDSGGQDAAKPEGGAGG